MTLEQTKDRFFARLPWSSRPEDAESAEAGDDEAGTPWWEFGAYAVLMLTAAGMRLWDLGTRAMHHDESLHSFYSWQLAEGDGYSHFPMTHGPFQFEASAAIFFVLGDSEFTGRLLYAVLGTVLVGMPFFLRSRLGRLGALIVSGLLVFSPAMLYFSRFARNDILMATWTLGLVIVMWRYLDEGKNRYLYIASALLALAFATKETAYMITVILGGFLALLVFIEILDGIRGRLDLYGLSPLSAAGRVIRESWSVVLSGSPLSRSSRAGVFLILLVTLTLPLWSATVSAFQDSSLLSWSNLVLAEKTGLSIGSATGGGVVIAALVVGITIGLSAYWGSRWSWSTWWRAALIFYTVWVLLFTTFFTNMGGIGSGVWQSLGYWIVQQDEARGGQPWYYYFVITSIYEFLPLMLGVIASVYYLRRANILWQFLLFVTIGALALIASLEGALAPLFFVPLLGVIASFFYLKWENVFGFFLVFWAVAVFAAFTLASEKMPWLLVNVALPLIVLAGKFLGDVIEGVEWRRLWSGGGWLLLPGLPGFLVLLWLIAFYGQGEKDFNALVPIGLGVALLVLAALAFFLAVRSGTRNLLSFSLVPLALVLLVLTVRTGFRASFENGDVPVEMIVYTQTSPDVTRLMKEIQRGADETGRLTNLPIMIDDTSGFSWPWAWYLRDYDLVYYQANVGGSQGLEPDTDVMVIHYDNVEYADKLSSEGYTRGRRVRHRWWFPEQVYRGLTVKKFVKGFVDRSAWRGAMDYFLDRDGVEALVGSEDSFVYFSEGFPREQAVE